MQRLRGAVRFAFALAIVTAAGVYFATARRRT